MLLLAVIFSACSIFQSTEKVDEVTSNDNIEEVYVFDEVSESEDNSKKINELKEEVEKTFSSENENIETVDSEDNFSSEPLLSSENSFYLQLGAFSSLKRAEQYTKENDSLVPFKLSIIFNKNNSLYTVRSSAYSTKEEVIRIRDKFKSQNLFTDSFIITE